MKDGRPIFLIGWYRSGTTMFWNMLRRNGKYTCFYEPLHENLLHYIKDQKVTIDPSHTQLDDYWTEYREIPFIEMNSVWRPWFGRNRFHIPENDDAKDLFDYISKLIQVSKKTPVLKFVRASFKANWLKRNFPEAIIVHIVRNPRSVWESMVGRECKDDSSFIHLASRIGFLNYMFASCADMGISLPGHPYRQFYVMWTKAFNQVSSVAGHVWWYDDLIRSPELWIHQNLIESGFLDKSPDFEIHDKSLTLSLHSDSWYLEQEGISQNNRPHNCLSDNKISVNEKILVDQIQQLTDQVHELKVKCIRIKKQFYRKEKKILSFLYAIKINLIKAVYQISKSKLKSKFIDKSNTTKRILFDCTSIVSNTENTGIQRVERNLINSCILIGKNLGIDCKSIFFLDRNSYKIVNNYKNLFYLDNLRLNLNSFSRFKSLAKVALPFPKFTHWLDKYWKGLGRWLLFFPLIIIVLPIALASIGYCILTYQNGTSNQDPNDIIVIPGSSWWKYDHILDVITLLKKNKNYLAVLIHDLLPVSNSEYFEPKLVDTFSKNLRFVVKKADLCISNSLSTKQSIAKYIDEIGIPYRPRLVNFRLGVKLDLIKSDGKIREDLYKIFNKKEKCFISVGTMEPRKNYNFLLKAFNCLWDDGMMFNLCIIGKYGWKEKDTADSILHHSQYGKSLIWYTDLSDAELSFCYKNAKALIYPSQQEGFGLPLIESLILKCPVIVSDIPVFREIGGKYCKYFSLESYNNLVKCIKAFEEEEENYRKLIETFKWPDWEESAYEFLLLLKNEMASSTNDLIIKNHEL